MKTDSPCLPVGFLFLITEKPLRIKQHFQVARIPFAIPYLSEDAGIGGNTVLEIGVLDILILVVNFCRSRKASTGRLTLCLRSAS